MCMNSAKDCDTGFATLCKLRGTCVLFFQFFVKFYCQSIVSGHTIICAFMTTNLTNLMVTLKICTITVHVFMPWPGEGRTEENSILP